MRALVRTIASVTLGLLAVLSGSLTEPRCLLFDVSFRLAAMPHDDAL
jgi:hypothetical protein